MGQLLRDEHLLPDLIMVSTAKRARETVEGLVSTSGYSGDIERKRSFYLAGTDAYIKALSSVQDTHRRVMVVGHNPGMEELVQHLTETSITMPTAALVEIALPITHWRELNQETRGELRGVWKPRELP
jgi:phosphohistidine phosphatase